MRVHVGPAWRGGHCHRSTYPVTSLVPSATICPVDRAYPNKPNLFDHDCLEPKRLPTFGLKDSRGLPFKLAERWRSELIDCAICYRVVIATYAVQHMQYTLARKPIKSKTNIYAYITGVGTYTYTLAMDVKWLH